jgi:hypothetical protein
MYLVDLSATRIPDGVNERVMFHLGVVDMLPEVGHWASSLT